MSVPPTSQRFRKSDRLRRRSEYREVQTLGRRIHTRHLIIILLPRTGKRRLGITVTKKVGTAVQRNRIKRLVREVFRRNRHIFPNDCDVVCIAKRGAPALSYDEVLRELQRARRAMTTAVRRGPVRDAEPRP